MLRKAILLISLVCLIAGCGGIRVIHATKKGGVISPIGNASGVSLIGGGAKATGAGIASEFSPRIANPSDFDSHLKFVDRIKGIAKSDERGDYYYDRSEGYLKKTYLNKIDAGPLREALKNGKGLVAPIYVVKSDPSVGWGLSGKSGILIAPDWVATARRIKYLKESLRLDILPIEASREFDRVLFRVAIGQGEMMPSFGPETMEEILLAFEKSVSKQGVNYQYVVEGSLLSERYMHAPIEKNIKNAETYNDGPPTLAFLDWANFLITNQYIMYFVVRDVYSNLQAGDAVVYSSCMMLQESAYRANLVSGSNKKTYSQTRSISPEVHERFRYQIGAQQSKTSALEKFCAESFRALNIVGRIRSTKF